jgi:peptide deformylase
MTGVQVAPLSIYLWPDPFLESKQYAVVTTFDDKLKALAEQLVNLMYLREGVGIAAPQGGINLRLCIVDIGKGPLYLINPEFVSQSEEMIDSNEGCLSFPGIEATHIKRHKMIDVKASDLEGNEFVAHFDGHDACIVQHEIDHLSGITILDRVGRIQRDLLLKKYIKVMKQIKLYNDVQEKMKK